MSLKYLETQLPRTYKSQNGKAKPTEPKSLYAPSPKPPQLVDGVWVFIGIPIIRSDTPDGFWFTVNGRAFICNLHNKGGPLTPALIRTKAKHGRPLTLLVNESDIIDGLAEHDVFIVNAESAGPDAFRIHLEVGRGTAEQLFAKTNYRIITGWTEATPNDETDVWAIGSDGYMYKGVPIFVQNENGKFVSEVDDPDTWKDFPSVNVKHTADSLDATIRFWMKEISQFRATVYGKSAMNLQEAVAKTRRRS